MHPLSTLAAIALVVGLLVLARSIEPHFSSKDGMSFTCRVRSLAMPGARMVKAPPTAVASSMNPFGGLLGGSRTMNPFGLARWRETRALVTDTGVQLLDRRQPRGDVRRIVGRSESPPPRSNVYVLEGSPMLLLRIPKRSRTAPLLDRLIAQHPSR